MSTLTNIKISRRWRTTQRRTFFISVSVSPILGQHQRHAAVVVDDIQARAISYPRGSADRQPQQKSSFTGGAARPSLEKWLCSSYPPFGSLAIAGSIITKGMVSGTSFRCSQGASQPAPPVGQVPRQWADLVRMGTGSVAPYMTM